MKSVLEHQADGEHGMQMTAEMQLSENSDGTATNKMCNHAHWRDICPSAYEQDLLTNEKVEFQNLDPHRTFEKSFSPLAFPVAAIRAS